MECEEPDCGEYLDKLEGKLWAERLPAYAPELNPVEYLWSYWKNHELPNLCPKDLWQFSTHTTKALRRIRGKKHRLICTFWKQAALCLYPHYIMRLSIEALVKQSHFIKRILDSFLQH